MFAHEVKAYFAVVAILSTASTVVTLVAISVALCRRSWWPLWVMLLGEVLDFLCDKHVAILPSSTVMDVLKMGLNTLGICALLLKLADEHQRK
jgi:hypothetical protein